MRVLEVKDTSVLPDMTTEPGLYFFQGMLYVAAGGGMYPYAVAANGFKFLDVNTQGMQENITSATLLKAIAVSAKPELICQIPL